jgi:Rod binding domain-containing protein
VAELSIASSLPFAAIKAPAHAPDDPAKIHDAAQQFESLLIGQILRSERESGNGWLGSGEDPASDCATDYAEQQFATLLARQGGLGLASLIAAGLKSAQAVATGSNSLAHSSLPAPETKSGTRD